jgi:hypothetical protein
MLIIKAKLTNIYVKINSKTGGFYVKKRKRRGFILWKNMKCSDNE